ncbi:hypothetical protein [Mycolicibacterium brumae]|nr:hypothetical protein [Mycolicibacterium brumae]MCV7191488.1 hypothetical protein [Mycolicibacterium brumae]RWA16201.1 hypothetical protein MBRU_08825 [Mycolicibacterium brumae DSM 44177]UWW09405.1 hypothetical protein L2Z93_002502 [Mycolicibacterium brumae]
MTDPRYGSGLPDYDGQPRIDGWQQDCDKLAEQLTDAAAELLSGWLD